MTDAADSSPVIVTGDNLPNDDSLPSDSLFQSETTSNEGNIPDLPPTLMESTLEMQTVTPTAETVTPTAETITLVNQVNRSREVNVEWPSWLPENWKIETKLRTSGATAGMVDKYYYEPVSGTKFRSKNEVLYFLETGSKRKKGKTESSSDATPSEPPKSKNKTNHSKTKKVNTAFYFDSANPPESVCWIQTNSSEDTWAPSVNGSMIHQIVKQEWETVFSSVSKLKISNIQKEK